MEPTNAYGKRQREKVDNVSCLLLCPTKVRSSRSADILRACYIEVRQGDQDEFFHRLHIHGKIEGHPPIPDVYGLSLNFLSRKHHLVFHACSLLGEYHLVLQGEH